MPKSPPTPTPDSYWSREEALATVERLRGAGPETVEQRQLVLGWAG